MQSIALANLAPRTSSWTGRSLSALVVLFMVFDSVIHLVVPAPVVEAFAQLGFPLHLSVGLGILELVFTALYVIPRSKVLGALLLTAYLGGATAAQVRIEAGWFPLLFPAIVAALMWGGLALRDSRVLLLVSPARA